MTDRIPTDVRPAAVLWDMDGTIVDTEPYWMRAEGELVGRFGGTWTHEDGLMLVGNGLSDSAAIIQARGVEMPIDEIVQWLSSRVTEMLGIEGVPWRPGARELLSAVREAGYPTALVTMSLHHMAAEVAAAIPFDAFDVIVAGDDVENPKPRPDAYLKAAELLGVDAEDCVAIEDSLTGLTAAVAAGTIAIGVPHIVPLPQQGDHTLWDTLAGRTVADLEAVAAERRAAA